MFIIKNLVTTIIVCLFMGLVACGNTKSDAAEQTQAKATTALSIEGGKDSTFAKTLNANLKTVGVEQTVTDVFTTPIANLYWVGFTGVPGAYVTSDAQQIIQGDILTLDGNRVDSLKSRFLTTLARDKLAAEPHKNMIIYPAKGKAKHIIYVFTDTECGYCRKFHEEINEINNQGVEVRYLAWPRSPETMPLMESLWCSDNRTKTLTLAKAGAPVPAKTCDNPVLHQQALGMLLGVNGTPAVFTSEGGRIGGYLSPEQLMDILGQ